MCFITNCLAYRYRYGPKFQNWLPVFLKKGRLYQTTGTTKILFVADIFLVIFLLTCDILVASLPCLSGDSLIFFCFLLCEGLHWQRLSVGYGSNENGLKGRERHEWTVCSTFIEATTCNHQFLSLSDEDSYHYLHQKDLDVPFLCSTIVLYCTTVCCVPYLAMLYYNFKLCH